MIWSLLLLLLIILLIASIPTYPYGRGCGYTPAGAVVYLLRIWFGVVALWYPWAAAPVAVD